jgi:hypothetical protein
MVQADALLHEAFATMRHSAGLYADRRPPALTGVEAVAVEHRLHVEQRQQLAVEGARPSNWLTVRITH